MVRVRIKRSREPGNYRVHLRVTRAIVEDVLAKSKKEAARVAKRRYKGASPKVGKIVQEYYY